MDFRYDRLDNLITRNVIFAFIVQYVLFTSCTLVICEMEPFIVGGDYADIKEYPHSVLVIVDCEHPYICGGSILTDRIVLTAGHCLYPCKHIPDYTILLKYGHRKSEFMASTMVSKFVTHSGYNDLTLEHDIGMAYVDNHIKLNDNAKRIVLAAKYPRQPKYGYVAGWGIVNSKGDMATSLKHVKQSFPHVSQCKTLGHLSSRIICAGVKHETEYPDQGDSGSALIIYDYIQIGIVSFKHPDYGHIGYTNTTYYYKWIVDTSKSIYCGH